MLKFLRKKKVFFVKADCGDESFGGAEERRSGVKCGKVPAAFRNHPTMNERSLPLLTD